MPTLIACGVVVLMTAANPLLIIVWPLFAFVAWFSWKFIKAKKVDAAERVPQTLLVTKNGVLAEGSLYAASDIAEVQWSPRNARGPARTVVTPDSHTLAASQAMGRNIGANIEHACWIVKLRLRSDSRPVTVAHHLDPQTAEALGKEILSALA